MSHIQSDLKAYCTVTNLGLLQFLTNHHRTVIIIMKIYETKTAPNPRRVRMFLAEKGIDVDYVQVDIQKGENLTAEMRAKNPLGKIPILELDDGTCIAETDAICTYFEALQPEPPLMGTTPVEKATISEFKTN